MKKDKQKKFSFQNKSLDEMEDDGSIIDFFKSEEFRIGFSKLVEAETWGCGLPKIYLDNDGWIVEHWKNGTINRLKKIK